MNFYYYKSVKYEFAEIQYEFNVFNIEKKFLIRLRNEKRVAIFSCSGSVSHTSSKISIRNKRTFIYV